jgi:uncharacterized protein (TIRG00374 family)
VLAVFVLSFRVDVSALLQVQRFEFLAASFVLQTLNLVGVVALRTRYFVFAVKQKTMRFWETVKKLIEIEFANKFVYYVFPSRINVPTKAFFVDRVFGTGKKNALFLTTFEYALDSSILLLVSFVGLAFFIQGVPQDYLQQVTIVSVLVLAGLAFYFLFPVRWFEKAKGFVGKLPWLLGKIGVRAIEFFVIARSKWKTFMFSKEIVALSFVVFALQVFSLALLFLAYDIVPPSLLEIAWVYAMSLVIGGISQIPGGLGVRETALGFLFSFVGIQLETGIAVALVFRAFTVFPVLAGYHFALKLGFMKKKWNNQKGEHETP